MGHCERQSPRQQRACFASLKVSRFVSADRPADRSGRERILFGCPLRTSCRSPSPTGQENEIAPVVCGWFVRSSPRITLRVWWSSGKGGFYGGVTGLSGRRPNLWGCVWLANVAGLLIRHSGCRAGQRGDAAHHLIAHEPLPCFSTIASTTSTIFACCRRGSRDTASKACRALPAGFAARDVAGLVPKSSSDETSSERAIRVSTSERMFTALRSQ
jgi:hypothetical protein